MILTVMDSTCFEPWSVGRRPSASGLSESHQGAQLEAGSAGWELSASLWLGFGLEEDRCQ